MGADGGAYVTPTGDPCPRVVRIDGTVEGSGHCGGCGFCLLLLAAAEEGFADPADRG